MVDSESHSPVSNSAGGEPDVPLSEPTAARARALRQARVRLGAVIALAIAGGFIAWAALGGSGGSDNNSRSVSTAAGTGPVVLSYSGLTTLAQAVGQPIYWIGAKAARGTLYELRRTTDSKVFVRYVPANVKAGDPRAFLTIGTYPMQNAFSVTQAAARGDGSTELQPGNGAIGFYGKGAHTNAYVAFPGTNYQIEVYSPTPGVARRLVEQGAVKQVPRSSPINAVPKAVSASALSAIANQLGQPIYWAGPQAGMTYEVRQASAGRIYVRYLPKGVKVDAPGSYLTVGTYLVSNAFAVTKGLIKSPGNASLKLKGGGVAAYKKSAKTESVFLAYPGSDFQIEVFDPKAGGALELVTSGRIAAIR